MTTTITPSLWFDDALEDAIDLYSSIFPDTKRKTYVLPVKKAVRTAEGLVAGSIAVVALEIVTDA